MSDARLSHTCVGCQLHVRIDAPDLHLQTGSNERKQRHREQCANVIKAQVPWEFLCFDCTEWWQDLIHKISRRRITKDG